MMAMSRVTAGKRGIGAMRDGDAAEAAAGKIELENGDGAGAIRVRAAGLAQAGRASPAGCPQIVIRDRGQQPVDRRRREAEVLEPEGLEAAL